MSNNAEYKALERIVTADKRYRRFLYALSLIFFILVLWGGYNIQQNIEHKIDSLVNGSVKRGNQRAAEQKTIARETIRYTTCIFVVPIEERTSDTQQKCFEAADLPGGLTRADFSPVVVPIVIGTSAAQDQSSATSSAQSPLAVSDASPQPLLVSSSPQSAPNTSSAQANNSPSTSFGKTFLNTLSDIVNFINPFN